MTMDRRETESKPGENISFLGKVFFLCTECEVVTDNLDLTREYLKNIMADLL